LSNVTVLLVELSRPLRERCQRLQITFIFGQNRRSLRRED
jgi:hypothetical protein